MFGISFDKIIVIAIIAGLVIGPQRLPMYASKFAEFIKTLKRMADGAMTRVNDELGPEVGDVDWRKLDPRQYDPRRIIRTALLDEEPVLIPTMGQRGDKRALSDEADDDAESALDVRLGGLLN